MTRILGILVCVGWAATAQAQVVFDCEWDLGSASQGSPLAFASNAGDHSCTPSATTNHLIICALQGSIAFTAPSMTWGGASMGTAIVGPTSTSVGSRTTVLFGKIANTTGAQTISASWTGGTMDAELGCAQFSNTDQTTGWQNSGTDTGTGTTGSSIVTSANNDYVVVSHANNNGTATAISAGTTVWLQGGLNGNYAMGRRLSTGATQTVTWTWTGSQAWANTKLDIIVNGGGGGRTTKNTRANPLGSEIGWDWRVSGPIGVGGAWLVAGLGIWTLKTLAAPIHREDEFHRLMETAPDYVLSAALVPVRRINGAHV